MSAEATISTGGFADRVSSDLDPDAVPAPPPTDTPAAPAADGANANAAPPDRVGSESVAALRSLLGASDQSELEALRDRLGEVETEVAQHGVTPTSVASALPAALRELEGDDDDLANAMAKPVRHSIHIESRTDPDAMAEALFPVLGRATRMMLSELLSGDSQSGNGKSFVVDELYLIERETGLPIATLHTDAEGQADADVVSGMLEGIRAFVQDSFNAQDRDGMRELQVGEVTVWVEWGPHAILAAVLRGFPNPDFRFEMARTLEDFHRDFDQELDTYAGDSDAFGNLQPRLARLQDLAPAAKPAAGRAFRLFAAFVLVAVAFGILVLAAVGLMALSGA